MFSAPANTIFRKHEREERERKVRSGFHSSRTWDSFVESRPTTSTIEFGFWFVEWCSTACTMVSSRLKMLVVDPWVKTNYPKQSKKREASKLTQHIVLICLKEKFAIFTNPFLDVRFLFVATLWTVQEWASNATLLPFSVGTFVVTIKETLICELGWEVGNMQDRNETRERRNRTLCSFQTKFCV